MQESIKSKLIVFSRLWAVPMVLFVLLSITAVVAAMNNHADGMGLAVVGTVLMLIIQLAQLVSAVVLRRWWCVTGAAIGVAVSLFVAASSIVALAAGQWRAPDIDNHHKPGVVDADTVSFSQTDGQMPEYYSFPVKFQGKTPTISDFIVAITTMEDPGEWMDYLGNRWTEYRRGDKYEGRFTVDNSKGYVRYDEEEVEHNGVVHTGFTEFCCWICDDNRHYIVATACNIFDDGVAIDGQSSGITMYLYDSRTRWMEMVTDERLGVRRPDVQAIVVYSLPSTGKDITATVYDAEKGEYKIVYVWNGHGFDLEN